MKLPNVTAYSSEVLPEVTWVSLADFMKMKWALEKELTASNEQLLQMHEGLTNCEQELAETGERVRLLDNECDQLRQAAKTLEGYIAFLEHKP